MARAHVRDWLMLAVTYSLHRDLNEDFRAQLQALLGETLQSEVSRRLEVLLLSEVSRLELIGSFITRELLAHLCQLRADGATSVRLRAEMTTELLRAATRHIKRTLSR
jgi:hypothetical protein